MSEKKNGYASKLLIGAFVYALGFLAISTGKGWWIVYLVSVSSLVTYEVIREQIICKHKLKGNGLHCSLLVVSAWVGSYMAYQLSTTPRGKVILSIIFVMVMTFDTFSQVCGVIARKTGPTRPIAPNESKNKTVEGTIGGYVMSWIAGIVVFIVTFDRMELNLTESIILGRLMLLLPIVAYFGDINESMAKRRLYRSIWNPESIKDFSRILRSVGGVSDRFDGMLAALAVIGPIVNWLLL